jgi:intein/homing endonuclease
LKLKGIGGGANHRILNKKMPTNTMDKTSYIAGLISADGHLDKNEKSVSIYSNNRVFSERIRFLLKEESGAKAKIYASKNAYKIYSYCPSFYNLLVERYNLFIGRKSHRLKFPENLNLEEIKSFIKGYVDGDGCVYVDKRKRRGKIDFYLRVEIASKSKKFLTKIKKFLEKNKVVCGKIKKGERVFRLCIYASNAKKFVHFIGFRHPEKILSFPIPQGVDKLQTLDPQFR